MNRGDAETEPSFRPLVQHLRRCDMPAGDRWLRPREGSAGSFTAPPEAFFWARHGETWGSPTPWANRDAHRVGGGIARDLVSRTVLGPSPRWVGGTRHLRAGILVACDERRGGLSGLPEWGPRPLCVGGCGRPHFPGDAGVHDRRQAHLVGAPFGGRRAGFSMRHLVGPRAPAGRHGWRAAAGQGRHECGDADGVRRVGPRRRSKDVTRPGRD